MLEERRRWKRFNCEFVCSLLHLGGNAGSAHPAEALVKDISSGGIRVWTQRFIPLSTRILSYLQLPNRAPVAVHLKPAWTAELRHFDRYETGFTFEAVSDEEKSLLEDYQQELSRAV